MALITCPKCGKYISDKALACPKCSHSMLPQEAEPVLDPVALSGHPDPSSEPPEPLELDLENDVPLSGPSYRQQMQSVLGEPPHIPTQQPYGNQAMLQEEEEFSENPDEELSMELKTSYWSRNTKRMLLVSHWHHLTEHFDYSPQAFYAGLSQAIAQRRLGNVVASRVVYREGGLFSAKREYLQISLNEHTFEICGAPYGTGFFVSWRLGEIPSLFWMLVELIPFIGGWLIQVFHPMTYFRIDTALMFQELVRSAVNEVIDEITSDKGIRALTEDERKPIMRDFFLRR